MEKHRETRNMVVHEGRPQQFVIQEANEAESECEERD